MKRHELTRHKFLQDEELVNLERILSNNKTERNALMLELLLRTGARAQELLNVTKSDINDYDKTITIKGLKGSDDREIPLPRELFFRLTRHSESIDGNLVFPITVRRLQAIWHVYRPVKKGIHCLRHTFAIKLYERTKDLRLVQLALGHRSYKNTLIYSQYCYKKDEFRRLIVNEAS